MGQKIGNIGVLNLINATEESIKDIVHIENVGLLLYSPKTASLLTKLHIGNIGKSSLIESEYRLNSGMFILDNSYLKAVTEPTRMFVNGVVIVHNDVSLELLNDSECEFIINGVAYTPSHLKGAVQTIFKETTGSILTYEGKEPIPKIGKVNIDNNFLQSLSGDENFIINGKLYLDENLDTDLFNQKINRLDVNGMAVIYENQVSIFSTKGLVNGKITTIPAGFKLLKTKLFIDGHSIRRFRGQPIYAEQPIILNKNVSREMFSKAFTSIESTSYIVCHENIEDLVYEALSNFETEVYVYSQILRYVDEETWNQNDLSLLEQETTLIVEGLLSIEGDVNKNFFEKISAIELIGNIHVSSSEMKAIVQKLVKTAKGSIINVSSNQREPELDNIGELTL
ncbi:hypothetical protein [Cytobacillus purgationiresistens]|uniref:Uncharacterized protein n=1 Tax=Cytobacillus purgationiresistens TaxID=863449 RepID=A0ABU0AMQ6_9BACI|nr:hypothetical protein [Cytobacillus purgationiresistens]MDQ0272536.1 hypothetical protein [Cytobacillus purgationiresistens]